MASHHNISPAKNQPDDKKPRSEFNFDSFINTKLEFDKQDSVPEAKLPQSSEGSVGPSNNPPEAYGGHYQVYQTCTFD